MRKIFIQRRFQNGKWKNGREDSPFFKLFECSSHTCFRLIFGITCIYRKNLNFILKFFLYGIYLWESLNTTPTPSIPKIQNHQLSLKIRKFGGRIFIIQHMVEDD